MPRPELLTESKIADRLMDIQLWSRDGHNIIRECHAANFVAVIGIINSIAILAEKIDHHPDMFLYGWNKLRITISTHDKGGLTELDFKLARQIEDLGFGRI